MKTINHIERAIIKQSIGAFIADVREAKGWTRYELAKRAGMSEAHIKRIEEGNYSVRVDIFNHLCRVLDTQIVFPIVENSGTRL